MFNKFKANRQLKKLFPQGKRFGFIFANVLIQELEIMIQPYGFRLIKEPGYYTRTFVKYVPDVFFQTLFIDVLYKETEIYQIRIDFYIDKEESQIHIIKCFGIDSVYG